MNAVRRMLSSTRIGAVVALTIIWILLWDDISLSNTLLGVVLACVIIAVFPLPQVPYDGRLRPIGLLRYLARFFYDLVVASFELAWMAIRPGPPPSSRVLTVQLRSRSDVQVSMTAITVSLVPGSLVIDVDRYDGLLTVHALGVDTDADASAFYRGVRDLETRVLRAIGSDAEVAELEAEPPSSPGGNR